MVKYLIYFKGIIGYRNTRKTAYMTTHILIIDDDEKICRLITRLLQREGYDVTYVLSAKQAVCASYNIATDLIITDIMMPDINGRELTEMIRQGKTNFHKNIPIIMVSALYQVTDRIAGIKDGADDYLVKPFEPDELIVRVVALLRRNPPLLRETNIDIIDDRTGCVLSVLQRKLKIDDTEIQLSDKETLFLKIIMQNMNVPINKHEITRQLYRELINTPESRTAEVMIGRLRKKLEENNCKKIKTKRGDGYYWDNQI
jgi:DNA-binding response OmpR family regulator